MGKAAAVGKKSDDDKFTNLFHKDDESSIVGDTAVNPQVISSGGAPSAIKSDPSRFQPMTPPEPAKPVEPHKPKVVVLNEDNVVKVHATPPKTGVKQPTPS